MMGPAVVGQDRLFYDFNLEDMVPADHLLRRIDSVLDLSWLRAELKPHYSHPGSPSVCPELMVRMLLVGYCYSIRSERRLCQLWTEAYWQSAVGRKQIERLFGEAKRHLSMARLRLRGLTGARDEFLLTATVQNLRRLVERVAIPHEDPLLHDSMQKSRATQPKKNPLRYHTAAATKCPLLLIADTGNAHKFKFFNSLS